MYEVIDFFSGAGGFSEGFAQAGYDIVAAIDFNEEALASHEKNHPKTDHHQIDLSNDNYQFLFRDYNPDIVIGSPPCQSFSTANTTNRDDKEGMKLVNTFYEIVKKFDAKYWIGENVPGSRKAIQREIPTHGRTLNSANFGVAQKRHRYFFGEYPLPYATHSQKANMTLDAFFKSEESRVNKLKSWRTIADIIEDVPKEEWMDFEDLPETAKKRVIDHGYQKIPKFNFYKMKFKDETPGVLPAHNDVSNLLLVDGVNSTSWADKESAPTMTASNSMLLVQSGNSSASGSLVQSLDNPGWTATTRQNFFITNGIKFRKFKIVEFKRIMGFPDDYVILGSRTAKIRQLGNAVCPPVAKAIGERIKEVEQNDG